MSKPKLQKYLGQFSNFQVSFRVGLIELLTFLISLHFKGTLHIKVFDDRNPITESSPSHPTASFDLHQNMMITSWHLSILALILASGLSKVGYASGPSQLAGSQIVSSTARGLILDAYRNFFDRAADHPTPGKAPNRRFVTVALLHHDLMQLSSLYQSKYGPKVYVKLTKLLQRLQIVKHNYVYKERSKMETLA